MSFDVQGKVALVTGANRGIGKAITEALLKHGATKVYAAVRDPASAEPLVEEYGDKVVPLEFDLTKPETINKAADVASDVSLLINNAGVLRTTTPFSDDAIEALQFEMEVNVHGLIYLARAFAPVLKANGGGAGAAELGGFDEVFSGVHDLLRFKSCGLFGHPITSGIAEGPGNSSAQCPSRTDCHRHGRRGGTDGDRRTSPGCRRIDRRRVASRGDARLSRFDGEADWRSLPKLCRKRGRGRNVRSVI